MAKRGETAKRGESVLDLIEVMDRLRSPGGCPWDARQTHESLVEYLVEEAYETVEAIEGSDDSGLREELGDLLLQVVFHARIAQERGEEGWDIDDVARGIVEKLIRRHPHVFADVDADTAEQVEANWHALKAEEKGRASVADGIPEHLPALLRASKVHSRSTSLGDAVPRSGQHTTRLPSSSIPLTARKTSVSFSSRLRLLLGTEAGMPRQRCGKQSDAGSPRYER